MATTTDVSATADNWLAEAAPTAAYGGGALLQIGIGGDILEKNGILEFDVSGFSNPTDIVSAVLTLTATAAVGVGTNAMKISRLTQSFTEGTSNWNTYDGSNPWTAGGAASDIEAGQISYSVNVGTSEDIVLDIRELVVDAIQKRSDTLLLVMYFDGTPSSSGYTKFASRTNSTADDRPKLSITVADRVAWTGARGDGDLDVGANWDTSSEPTADDYALFPSGSEDVLRGDLQCKKVYIGKNYKGSIGTTAAPITFEANELHCNSAYSACHIAINASISTVAEVWISDTARTLGSFRLNGKYTANVKRTRHDIALLTTNVTLVDSHTRRATFTCSDEVTTVRMSGASATLDDGAGSLTLTNGGYTTVSMVDNSGTEITVASSATVRCYAEEVDETIVYSGAIRFMGNEGAPISMVGLTVYPEGLADTRTGAATFTMGSAALMYGGRMLLDGSMAVAIA